VKDIIMTNFVNGFFEEHRFLSNFWSSEVEYDGVVYPTVEHAFQAAKFVDPGYREQIRTAHTPGAAKYLGRTRVVPLRKLWDEGLATQVMAELVAKKFASHPELAEKLLATGDSILVETNDWGDDTWGNSTTTATQGKNQLGIILMAVRSTLRAASAN
jgi:ribA/ribD-fused uncharacterized protein